jgi:cation diffusion facilitator CzcD-associated flavoprotein CzcO
MKSYDLVILGAGMSGICMAIKLRAAGITDFLIVEKTAGVGGTWHENTYPGACCDVASQLYSYSFEPNPDWSQAFSPQAEIEAYFERCVDKYAVRPHIRFDTEVVAADYLEQEGRWSLRTASGEILVCRILISGLGQLNLPNIPDFPGREDFSGVQFHSACWDHSVDLGGKRVAVIGNAASAIQFIPPVAAQAAQVFVYQRSANYIVPRNNRPYREAEQQRFRRFPWLQKLLRLRWYLRQELLLYGAMLSGSLRQRFLTRMALANMEQEIPDPELRVKLTPDYPLGCKRVLVSDDYYHALATGPVEVVTSPISGIGHTGVHSADGVRRDVDVIIYATGFRATEMLAPLQITGAGGVDINSAWSDGPQALRGVAQHGFPNFFMLYGPNTNLGHNSIIFMVEAQVNYVLQCVDKLLVHDLRAIEANAEAQNRFNEDLQAALRKTVWAGECGSWYKNAAGRITNNWPYTATRFRLSMRRPDFTEYDMSA